MFSYNETDRLSNVILMPYIIILTGQNCVTWIVWSDVSCIYTVKTKKSWDINTLRKYECNMPLPPLNGVNRNKHKTVDEILTRNLLQT